MSEKKAPCDDQGEEIHLQPPKVPTRKRNTHSFTQNYPLPPPRPIYSGYSMSPYHSPFSHQNHPYAWNPPRDWSGRSWNGEPESPFVRSAEASVKEAFASIESIVSAFTSIAQMLEATYNSVHSSFRAVLSVADNFSKLRQQLIKILRGFMMFGIGHRVFKRIWNCFAKSSSTQEAVQKVAWEMSNPSVKQDVWPFITFLFVVIAAPYFIYKMFPDGKPSYEDDIDNESDVATVLFPYQAMNPDEVSLLPQTQVIIAPQHLQPNFLGWILVSSNGVIGLAPVSHLQFGVCPD